MARKKTHEEFVREVFDLVGSEYEILGTYTRSKDKVKMRHNVCSTEYEVRPNGFTIMGTRCKVCAQKEKSKSKIKTHSKYVKQVFDKVGVEYTVLSRYTGVDQDILIEHNICGNKWTIKAGNFLNSGNRCPRCSKTGQKTTDDFKKEVFDLVGSAYEVIGKYEKNNIKVKMKHNQCSYEYGVRPSNFKTGDRCPKCYGNIKGTTEKFKKEVFKKVRNEYEVLGEYKSNKTKIKMKHIICMHEWDVRPDAFLANGTRCPKCCSKTSSIGEWEIGRMILNNYDGLIILNDRSIIPSMMTDKMYELDVYLPELKLAIEYNGSYWHEKRELEVPGYHDYKQRVCDEKGIELINVDDNDWKDKEKRKEIVKRILNKIKQ